MDGRVNGKGGGPVAAGEASGIVRKVIDVPPLTPPISGALNPRDRGRAMGFGVSLRISGLRTFAGLSTRESREDEDEDCMSG